MLGGAQKQAESSGSLLCGGNGVSTPPRLRVFPKDKAKKKKSVCFHFSKSQRWYDSKQAFAA